MRKLIILSVLLIFISKVTSAQESKFGDASMNEMNMSVYAQDTSAVALILLKKGETRFVYNDLSGFQFEYTFQTKIKILKNEGLEFCNQEISFFQESRTSGEKITGLSGTTYNLENGKITKTKLSKDFITDENIDEKWILRKFTMPAAKVGSVIEYKYTLVSDYFYDLRDFKFQSSVPTLYSYYQVTIPEYFFYNTNMQGYESIDTKRKPVNMSFSLKYRDGSGRMRMDNVNCSAEELTFVGKNLPAIKNEPYLWTLNDYMSMVSFELKSIKYPGEMIRNFSNSWENINAELLKTNDFGGNLKKAGYFKDDVAKGDLSLENAKVIQNMIKKRVKWDNKNRAIPSHLNNALKNGLGNSADINFLLINALKAAGFDAYPVVLSTRSNGRLPMANPSISALNYTITALKIDTTMYYTDASSKYGDWNILPQKCMVPQARIIDEGRSAWIDLTEVSSGIFSINNMIDFTDTGISCQISGVDRGCSAYDFRSNYYAGKDENEYIEKIESQISAKIENFKVTGADNPDEDVKVNFTVKKDIPGLGEEFIYFNPIIFKPFSENPFKSEDRKFPVNFDYQEVYRQVIIINIPKGYTVDELPKSEKFVFGDNNDLSFSYRIMSNEQTISLQYIYQVKNLLVLPTQYQDLKDFFSKVTMKNSEQIVLKKITQ